jgi:hypothetical protein
MRWDCISLSRCSLGEVGCSMRITEGVRKYAAHQEISEEVALEVGLQEKQRSL